MIAPGQVLTSTTARIPVVRIVCRYPFDLPVAQPRWVAEHINQPGRVVEIVDESDLFDYALLFEAPINVPLDGSPVAS
jgi:hypothetical protein